MISGKVINDEGIWQGHPDVAFFQGRIYVVFRESEKHRINKSTKIRIVSSEDGESFSDDLILFASENLRFNCPRLSVVDGLLWVVCDVIDPKGKKGFLCAENQQNNTYVWLRSTEDGVKWSFKLKTSIRGIVPDRLCKGPEGDYFIAAHSLLPYDPKTGAGYLTQYIWHATSMSPVWQHMEVGKIKGLNLCEASIFVDTNEIMYCIMRENSGEGLPAYLSISKDHGRRWTRPVATKFFGCHRPTLGQLKSGKFLMTYREQSFGFGSPYWARNTFACLIDENSLRSESPGKKSIILPLDHDRSKKSDSGYTGWIQLPDDSIYVVNYITDTANKPYIKWYKLTEKDFSF